MARIRTVDFLPEIFKTDVNREFLGATLDQLVREPELKKIEGYIGRRFGPGTKYNDSYVLEDTTIRDTYQLEPGVSFKDSNGYVVDGITYPGIVDALKIKGADVTRHDRLFESETYSWDPHIDFDKFINYSQYYWLPAGPDAVDVQSTDVALTDEFTVTETADDKFNFSGTSGNNPRITLVRGGSYQFNVNQDTPFWIQAEAGVDGTFNYSPNISTRSIPGIVNNGASSGTITFNVPDAASQQYYHNLTNLGTIDLATTERFDAINGRMVTSIDDIDGVTDLENKTIVFINSQTGDSYDLGWQRVGRFDDNDYDDGAYEPTTYLDSLAERYSLFRITFVRPDGSSDDGMYIELVALQEIDPETKFTITSGNVYSNRTYYKDGTGYFKEQPLLVSAQDYLYYQDGSTANKYGVIQLIDQDGAETINIDEDIVGHDTYISPNGVTFTNGLKVVFRGSVEPETYQDNEYYVEGVGKAITLTPVETLTTAGSFYNNLNDVSGQPTAVDYLTIKRDSLDRNAWSRSNRWFHRDVIEQTADYNETLAAFDNNSRAKRPIIEFDSNLRLFNFGTQAIDPIDVIDFATTDALSLVHGSSGYYVDGYNLVTGSRVVFANDTDPAVRNRIYEVELVDPDDDSTEYGTIVNLKLAADAEVVDDMVLSCQSGNTQTGQQYRYSNSEWILCQEKTSVQQEPLFDIFDDKGYSYSDTSVYPSSTFAGTKLFSYKRGTGATIDSNLGFPLSYENIDNIGDIVFDSNQYTDTFVYIDGRLGTTKNVSDGYTHTHSDRTTFSLGRGWTTSAAHNWQRQVFTFQYDGSTALVADVPARTDLGVPGVKVYVENKFAQPSEYTVTVSDTQTTVTFNSTSTISANDIVQVKILSKTASKAAYYEIPSNLSSNTFNQDKTTFTLGNIRSHYNLLTENIDEFSGQTNGPNNTRDIGNLPSYGSVIVQHSASLVPAAFFLRKQDYDLFEAMEASANAYERLKTQIANWVYTNDVYDKTAAQLLDEALNDINKSKNDSNAFYWSDMIPFGGDYTETVTTVSVITTRIFETQELYDFTSANFKGLLVYYNDTLLLKDSDYTVATDGPRVTLTFDPAIDDTITIREYATTYGSFVPPTPSKLGLYPNKDPEIYTDYTYVNPQTVIHGHDGSITVGFDDVRDDVLLEFERRIYNNLKLDGSVLPIEPEDVIPGEFRKTDYTLTEVNEILSEQFLDWAGQNNIDYKSQTYIADNEFTYNYSTASCKLDGSLLPGHWRGIYSKYYDTDRPHLHPWEMLGILVKPSWWETEYGPAPYTSGNLVLWQDLEAGYNRNADTYDARYARPGLTDIIPVDSEGNLRSPMQSIVAAYTQVDLRKSWNFGDGGPAEATWRRSSSYPFAVQKLYALTKPAKYFSLMVDRDLFKNNASLSQFVYNDRYGYDFKNTVVSDVNVAKHSYINWIVDDLRNLGIESMTELTNDISNVNTQLMYRVGGFTDKKYLKLFTDKSSLDSTGSSLSLPDESYSVILYKNQPTVDLKYSSVIVQKVEGGYAVYGNSTTESYFRIQKSVADNNATKFEFDNTVYMLPKTFSDVVVRVPYGHTFFSKTALVDFLVSYGEFLKRQGMRFESKENGYYLNWGTMCNEFLRWSSQGWSNGALININPAANELQYARNLTVVDDITQNSRRDYPQTADRLPMTPKDYRVTRLDNLFKLKAVSNSPLSYLRLKGVSYEHLVVIDNKSIFNDLVYDPVTGQRQHRLRVDGYKTANWNGQLNANGFILNQDNVTDWLPNIAYNKGDLVEFKNSYWTANKKLQPTSEFDFDNWTKIDPSLISKGLLPNAANRAEQIKTYYNNTVANLESDADLLGLGLTGFRTRDYLQKLNLNDISQIQVYSNITQNKGTTPTVEQFNGVTLNNLESSYDIFENWALKRSTYGASDNKRFVELALNNKLLDANPGTVGIGIGAMPTPGPLQPAPADQHIDVNEIYKQSVKNTNKNIFPALAETIRDTSLPSGGFVVSNDVDIQMYSINDVDTITQNLGIVREGTKVWVAYKNLYDWDVYRCTSVPATQFTVSDNLDGSMDVKFDQAHTLTKGQVVVLKTSNTQISAAYRVNLVKDYKTITLLTSEEFDEPVFNVTGIVFKLDTVRVADPSQISTQTYTNSIYAGDFAWVDNNNEAKWSVYERQHPYTSSASIVPSITSSVNYGSQVEQTSTNMMVSATNYETNGGVFEYVREKLGFKFRNVNTGGNNLSEFGASVSMQSDWAVIGAPGTHNAEGAVVVAERDSTNNYDNRQILINPDAYLDNANARFGDSVAISANGKWIYVAAPGIKAVHAYQLMSYQDQTARFTADGIGSQFDLTGQIKIDQASQITVSVNGVRLSTGDYTLSGSTLTIVDTPTVGQSVTVARINTVTHTADGTTTYFGVDDLYTAVDLESFSVYVNNVLQRPYYDYSFAVDSGESIEFAVAPAANAKIDIRANDYFKYVSTIDGTSINGFASNIKTTIDGQQVYVSAANSSQVNVYERLVERYVVTDDQVTIYTPVRSVEETSNVYLNSTQLTNSLYSVGDSYTISETLNRVTFNGVDLNVGDKIDIATNEFNLVQELTGAAASNFGESVSVCQTDCSVYVGAPHGTGATVPQAGTVTRYVNGSRVFGTITGSVANPTLTPTDTIRIDNVEVTITGTSVLEAADDINNANIPNVQAIATDGKLTISVINTAEAPTLAKLTVMPGAGTAFDDLGFLVFENVQTIRAPKEFEHAQFGSSVHISDDSSKLFVGAVTGATQLPVAFDDDETVVDSNATRIVDQIAQSGAVYTYDLLASATSATAGQFAFGQQVYDAQVSELDEFGTAVSYKDNVLVVSSKGYDTNVQNIGRLSLHTNVDDEAAWNKVRDKTTPADSRKIETCYIYNKATQDIDTYLDFIDPLNGKLLGVVEQNLDFKMPIDPATYTGNKGVVWGKERVGNVWWNTATARFKEYNQNDLQYASKVWGTVVEGSAVDVYEWIESALTPAEYEARNPLTVYDLEKYSTVTSVNSQRTISTSYYFWAKTSQVNLNAGKTLSANTIADYIEAPMQSGVPYIAIMRSNVVGLYNVQDTLRDNLNSILHIEFNQTLVDNNVFVEYDLVRQGKADDFFSSQIWRKFKDSLCGSDTLGNAVPDTNLSPTDKYGVSFRPRQSMFKNRYAALESLLTDANEILLSEPFAELRTFNLLTAEESTPLANSGAWDQQVDNITELGYQTPELDGVGYKYLVNVDENNNGLWTIYTVQSDHSLLLSRVQSYDTSKFWEYTDWYATGYSKLTKPLKIVDTYSELLTLTESVDTVVKVSTNSDNKWELYVYTANGTWNRIALQNGTIQLRTALWDYSVDSNGFDREVFDVQYFDQEPVTELRNVLEALAYEILIGDFLKYRNQLMISALDYILHEQGKTDWLYKTSLIDVSHKVRDLTQYPVYQQDNQDFVVDYINETKPYHVSIKDFSNRYEGIDILSGNVFDYDCPAAYDADYKQFISPILDDDIAILETSNSNRKDYDDDTIDQAASDVWTTRPWATWYDNHKLSIDSIIITDGGSGYTVAPVVTFTGQADTQAQGTATISETGVVTSITLTNSGAGYRTTPTITFTGGNGTGATAVAVTKHDLVRSLATTIKYDRYEYNTQVVDWEANTVYDEDQLVRYNNRVYRVVEGDGSTPSDATFDPLVHELVAASTLSGIDRTSGFYVSDVNNPGLDLALLINGLDYPMVQLTGPGFDQDTGFDLSAFDETVFDNIELNSSGDPTYSAAILDNEILTSFTGTYTGVDLSGIEAVRATATASFNSSTLEVTALTPVELGAGYSADVPPLVTISAPNGNVTATATALVSSGSVSSITVNNDGFGYLTAPTVTITEQSPTVGINATATATIDGGEVDSTTITLAGSGYETAPTVTFSDPVSVSTARATATATLTAGEVTSTTITNGGNSYSSAPAVTVSDPPASVTAEGTIALTASTYRVQPTGTVSVAGNYYSVAPTVTVGAPTATATQATASATISGDSVDSITVDVAGRMYQTAPTVTITPASPTAGQNASASATLSNTYTGFDAIDGDGDGFDAVAFDTEGGIASITVDVQGTGYTVAPTVTISAPDITGGTQATATATITGDSAPLYAGEGNVVSITVTEPGSGYTSAPTVTIAAPDETINHGTGATATATISDTEVVSITITSAGSYYDIAPTVTLSAPTTPYTATVTATVSNGIVTALTASDQGWGYETAPTLTIAAPDVTPTTAAFTAVLTGDAVTSLTIDDAGAGYLTAPTLTIAADASVASNVATGTAVLSDDGVASITITNAGATYVNPPTVTIAAPTGLTYHGSGATATATISDNQVTAITITNAGTGYDLAPTVTLSAPTRNTRQATADPIVTGGQVTGFTITDAGYGYLRTPTVSVGIPSDVDPDADIVGGSFIDVYNSHAPEELVPGAIFDTLDLRVYTRPGFDYSNNGHGFEVKTVVKRYTTSSTTISWDNLIDYPAAIDVLNSTTGLHLYKDDDYTIDWVNKTITITNGVSDNQEVKIYVYSLGGGNQLYKYSTTGEMIVAKTLTIPVDYDSIETVLVQVNGEKITSYTYAEGSYASQTDITFASAYTSSDYISVTVFADNPAEDGSTLVDFGYSIPNTEVFTATGASVVFDTTADLRHAGASNLVVEHNGLRLRPAAGIRHIGDGSTGTYELPNGERTGIDVDTVDDTKIDVYVNSLLQVKDTNYTVTPSDDSSLRTITFITEFPGPDDVIDIYVAATTGNIVDGVEQGKLARYIVDNDAGTVTLTTSDGYAVNAGDTIAITSFGDVREQGLLTEVFQGPITTDTADRELWDQYGFDVDLWDRVTGIVKSFNTFALSTTVTNAERTWVTLNGRRLLPSLDYSLTDNGTTLVIAGAAIRDTDVVVVTSYTNSVVPASLNFRIFKDMRDNVGVYRIQNNIGVTELAQDLHWLDDTIYVKDASVLSEPNLDAAIFGIVMINGERITYRERNTTTNTLSGLRRSTAGTGLPVSHSTDTVVTDMGAGEALTTDYDKLWYSADAFDTALQQQETVAARFLRGE